MLLALPVAAQVYEVPEIEISKDKVRVDGKSYYAHVVTAKQTLFSISKAYGVTVDEIYEANRNLQLETAGLKTGQVILIPTESAASAQEAPEPEAPESPEVTQFTQGSDTLDSRALFPRLRDIFSKILNPLDSLFTTDIPGTINVSLLLPFNAGGKQDSKSLDFYAGALLAARDLGAQGIDIDIHTYDIASGNISSAMLGGDVILGPISSNDVKFAASIAPYGKRIISPLEPRVAGMSDTMRVVHVPTPAAAQYADAVHWAVADMVPGDSLVLVLQSGKSLTDNASAMVSALRESGVRYAAISYGILDGTRVQAQFNAHAAKYGTTRYLVASEDESFVNDAVRNMNLMVYKKNDVVFYAPSRVRTFSTIETENLHNVSTHISATYYIDYGNPDVQAFVMAYRALFGSEPNSFSFHGYDTMRYFVTMCSRYGRNWFQKLTGQNWKGLQTDFSFEKTYSGQGQVNTAVRRIVYTPEYKTVLQ